MLRHRKKSQIYGVEVIKQLDSFPKVNKEDFVEKSRIGGIVSVVVYIILTWVTYYEIRYYLESNVDFKFSPDTDFNAKLKFNLDMIVAMPCDGIGADILDSTNQNMLSFGSLDLEDAWFDMSPNQLTYFNDIRYYNSYLREEFHAINHLLWKSGQSLLYKDFPKWEGDPNESPDACRVHGSLILNKVAGNMHITAGKSLALAEGHIHLSPIFSHTSYNFSHRIYHLSFGDSQVGIIQPLDGEEKISDESMSQHQYFIEVVPTDVETFLTKAQTYQYSVQDNNRVINHNKGSHGMPGIYFKYDVSALKVTVTQSREPILKLFIRLTSTLAGIFVTAGIIKDCLYSLQKKISRTDKVSQLNSAKSVLSTVAEEVKCDIPITKSDDGVII